MDSSDGGDDISMSHGLDSAARVLMSFASSSLKAAHGGEDTPGSRFQPTGCDDRPIDSFESSSTADVKDEEQDGWSMGTSRTLKESENMLRAESHENSNTQSVTCRHTPPGSGHSHVSSSAKGHPSINLDDECAETQLSTSADECAETQLSTLAGECAETQLSTLDDECAETQLSTLDDECAERQLSTLAGECAETQLSTSADECAETQLSTSFQSGMQTQGEDVLDAGTMEIQVQPQHHSDMSGESSIPFIEQGLHVHFSSTEQATGESSISCTRQLDPLDQSSGTEDDRNQMEEILDKTWKASYLDYNVESDDESDKSNESDYDERNDLDFDPDYNKSPEDDDDDYDDADDDEEDYNDSDDSDFLPGSKRKRPSSIITLKKRKSPACTAKRRKVVGHNQGIQEKIDHLKLAQRKDEVMLAKRMAEIEHIFKANEVADVDKDLNYLTVLLAKDAILRDNSYQWKDTQNMVKSLIDSEKNERELKEVVKTVLKRHNLLTTSFGPGTSLATAISYARILCPNRKELEELGKGSASSYLSSTLDEPLATGSSSVQTKQDVQVLSGRSFLLLQQIAQLESSRRRAVSANMSFRLEPVKSEEGKTILESVLKSMLTEPIEPEPVVNQLTPQSRSTLLRGMLMSDLLPLNSPSLSSLDGPSNRMECMGDKDPEVSCDASDNVISGFSVYVDNAHSEEQSSDADRCKKPKWIKSENVFTDKSSEPDHDLPTLQIKSEPHSPSIEFSSQEVRSKSTIGRHATEEASVEQPALNVRIKSEPPSEFGADFDWKSSTDKQSQQIPIQSGSSIMPETIADVPGDRCSPVSAADSLSQDSDLQMPSTNTRMSNLRYLLDNSNSAFTLKTTDSFVHNSGQQREVPRTVDLRQQKSKPGRPHYKETLSAKIARVKQGIDDERVDAPVDDSNSSNSSSQSSASNSTKSASVLSKSTPSHKNNTILRCLIDGSSPFGTERPAPHHAYNTRHKRRPDSTLLQEVLSSFRPTVHEILSRPTPAAAAVPNPQPSKHNLSRYGIMETVKTEKLDYVSTDQRTVNRDASVLDSQNNSPNPVATVKTEKQDHFYVSSNQSNVSNDVSDSTTHVSLIQNVTSCSQQLLNIIKSVGATTSIKTSESGQDVDATTPVSMKENKSKSENATILKAMLNSESPMYSGKGQGHPQDGSPLSGCVNVDTLSSNMIRPRDNLTRYLGSPNTISSHSSPSLDHDTIHKSPGRKDCYSLSPSVDHPEMNMKANASNRTDVDWKTRTGQSFGIITIDSGRTSSEASDSADVSSVLGVHPYQCRLCGIAFKVTSVLENHMLEHFGTKPFGCNICPKSYMTVKELEDHTAVHITELSPALVYKCTVCGKVFDTESEHNQHRRSHTLTTQKEIKHSRCDNNFGVSKLLVENLSTKHVPMIYACAKCTKRFKIRSEYDYHVRNCQTNSLISCSECESCFASREQLKYHCTRHHSQQAIMCAYCEARFRFQIHLDKHMLKVHKERFLPPSMASTRDDSTGVQPGQVDTDTIQHAHGSSDKCVSGPGNNTGSLTKSSLVVTISDSE